MESALTNFLSQCRSTAFDSSTTHAPTWVLGNPSADLDSFISAILISICYSHHTKASSPAIAVVNLPAVPSSDLWRLRPEFGTALRLAACYTHSQAQSANDHTTNVEKSLLQNIITIHDLQTHENTKAWFPARDFGANSKKAEVFLVDHNAPSIPNVSPASLSNLNLIGCIDHHDDESKVPPNASPRIITTGIGSCTSLVMQHLQDAKLWPSWENNESDLSTSTTSDSTSTQPLPSPSVGSTPSWVLARELSILALAPILIDTANLTAPGKVSDLDRKIVTYLETIIQATQGRSLKLTEDTTASAGQPEVETVSLKQTILTSANTAQNHNNGGDATRPVTGEKAQGVEDLFDRSDFYSQIAQSKASSLDNLTLPEILDRDYKEWTENEVKIGIASCVKPISYLLPKKASLSSESDPSSTSESATISSSPLLSSIVSFSHSNNLSIFILMTAFSSSSSTSSDSFQRELLILTIPPPSSSSSIPSIASSIASSIVTSFIESNASSLGLESWSEDQSFAKELQDNAIPKGVAKVYWQRALEKSRKQVAPMIRECARQAVKE